MYNLAFDSHYVKKVQKKIMSECLVKIKVDFYCCDVPNNFTQDVGNNDVLNGYSKC